jgi:deoxyribonuclease-4
MGEEALSIGANTFQYFTRNPRGNSAKDIDEADIKALVDFCREHQFAKLLAHASYTMNPCALHKHLRDYSQTVMLEDIKTLEHLPDNLYNFHPGNHMGQGIDAGIEFIIEILNNILFPLQTTTVLLETMAGKGTEVGSSFEEISRILKGVNLAEKMGVCLDTCHIYCAGYDVVNDFDGVLEKFDKIIGLNKLKAIHLNDSMMPFNSRKDRHQRIGEGTIGTEAIIRIINHSALKNIPFLLETPNELPGYAKEVKLLREAYQSS